MGFVFNGRCEKCGYETGLEAGDGKAVVALCRGCRAIVNAEMVPFRLDLPKCRGCRKGVDFNDLIDVLRLSFNWKEYTTSDVGCPRCDGKMGFIEKMHFSMEVHYEYPEPGALVHAFLDREGRVTVPGILYFDCAVQFGDGHELAPRDVAEVEVVGLEEYDNPNMQAYRQREEKLIELQQATPEWDKKRREELVRHRTALGEEFAGIPKHQKILHLRYIKEFPRPRVKA